MGSTVAAGIVREVTIKGQVEKAVAKQ
jgi:hypothetical protein